MTINQADTNGADCNAPSIDPAASSIQECKDQDDEPQETTVVETDTSRTDGTRPDQESLERIQTQLDALETMRVANLRVEFSSAGSFDQERCTFCQREELSTSADASRAGDAMATGGGTAESNGIGAKLRDLKIDGHRIRSLDGSRIRNFSKRFLGRANTTAAVVEEMETVENGDDDDDNADDFQPVSGAIERTEDAPSDNKQLHLTESCPAKLMESKTTTASLVENKSRKSILSRRPPASCLTCGHPTCTKHISKSFSTHHIQICQQCAYLFELDFLVDVIAQASAESNGTEICQQKVNTMIDCYDRAKLLLSCISQYTPSIIEGLQSRTAKSNKIGVGANASGIVSGITGIVGAGALLCPPVAAAGVPILIASLVFGGGATAAHTGDYAAVKYWSEPNIMADKMVVLHGMCLSLLRVVEILSYGLLSSRQEETEVTEGTNIEDDNADESKSNRVEEGTGEIEKREALKEDIRSLLERHGVNTALGKESISSSTNITGSNVANRHTRLLGRVGTTAAASFRFVPLAGGVLSAASLVVEANEIKATLARMNEGSPCEKSEQIKEIASEVDRMPDAALIAGECRRVFQEAESKKESTITSAKDSVDLSALDQSAFEHVVAKEITELSLKM